MLLTSYGQTDVGRIRPHNEDAFVCFPEQGLWIVADGMGGHACGEVASNLTCQVIVDEVFSHKNLVAAVKSAHDTVIDVTHENRQTLGMGSTVVVLKIAGNRYSVAWVGDSRAYLLSDTFSLISHDHSYVQQLIDSGAITESQARVHPQRNLITQSIGSAVIGELQVDSISGTLQPGDRILLCSDGLSGELSDDTIHATLQSPWSDKRCIEFLLNLAKQRGGRDNITAILVSFAKIPTFHGSPRWFSTLYSHFYMHNKLMLPILSGLSMLSLYQLLLGLF